MISIHAPLRGATANIGTYGWLDCNFNPRSPAGSDKDVMFLDTWIKAISIHAPLRGAT